MGVQCFDWHDGLNLSRGNDAIFTLTIRVRRLWEILQPPQLFLDVNFLYFIKNVVIAISVFCQLVTFCITVWVNTITPLQFHSCQLSCFLIPFTTHILSECILKLKEYIIIQLWQRSSWWACWGCHCEWAPSRFCWPDPFLPQPSRRQWTNKYWRRRMWKREAIFVRVHRMLVSNN